MSRKKTAQLRRTNTQEYCNRRNFQTCKNFVLQRSRTFVCYKFSYSEGSVRYTCIRARFSHASKLRTFSQKYETYGFNLHSKISAISVANKPKQSWYCFCVYISTKKKTSRYYLLVKSTRRRTVTTTVFFFFFFCRREINHRPFRLPFSAVAVAVVFACFDFPEPPMARSFDSLQRRRRR